MRSLSIYFLLSGALLLPITNARFLAVPEGFNAGLRLGKDTICTNIHIIAARGTFEEYPGRQHRVIREICNHLPSLSCGYEDIPHLATFDQWCASVEEAVENGKNALTDYARRCPDSAIVLTGFSMGTKVVGDILGGGGGYFHKPPAHGMGGDCWEKIVDGIPAVGSPGINVVAVLLWGDVRHTANQPYNIGSGSHLNGEWPRTGKQLEDLNRFSDVIGSWCHIDDPWCALGAIHQRHVDYLRVNSMDGAEFVRRQIERKMPWLLTRK